MPVLREQILDFFFSKRCFGCGRVGDFVCEACESQLPYLEIEYCPVCNSPSVGGFTHVRCRGRLSPDRLLCLFAYQGLAKNLIHGFKFDGVTSLAPLFTGWIKNHLEENGVALGEQALVTFVPSHPLKFLARGFNPSQLMAEAVARPLGLNVLNFLEKTKETKSQMELSREDRRENVKDSFGLMSNAESLVSGQDVLLVDDVFTTGATLLECSKVLKKAGVRFLYLLTLARD